MVAIRDLLRDLYLDTPPRADLQAAELPGLPLALLQGRLPMELPLLLSGGRDIGNAAEFGVRLGVVCADVVESLNAILKGPTSITRPAGGKWRAQRHYNGRGRWSCRLGSGGF